MLGARLRNHRPFMVIVALEIIAIALIALNTFRTHPSFLGAAAVSPLNAEGVVRPTDSKLGYFYELNIRSNVFAKPSWAPVKPEITLNQDNLNERFDYAPSKPPGTFRIVAIGDSFTFGHYVNTRDNYPETLEDDLNKLACPKIKHFEVINLGNPGYDIEYSVERFRRRGQKYQPDLVLWLLKNDDFDQINEFLLPRIYHYLDQSNLDRSKLIAVSDSIEKQALKDVQNQLGEEGVRSYQAKALSSISSYFQKDLLIFSLENYLTNDTYRKQLEALKKSRPRTYFFDQITIDSGSMTLPDLGHPNKEGYKKIAEALVGYLTSSKLITCGQ